MSKKIIKTVVAVVLLASIILCTVGCAELERAGKDIESSMSGGLDRVVNIYSVTGELIKSYEGKIDVTFDEYNGRLKFELNGKRYIYQNAIIEVIEK